MAVDAGEIAAHRGGLERMFIVTNKLTQAVLSGIVFLIVWLMIALLFGATITDTLLTAFIVALVFGAGIYYFGPQRGRRDG